MNDARPAVLKSPPRASTGIVGLDDVLRGGLLANRVYLVEGAPGAGKTTLALQFLLEGRHLGEAGLYVTLSESEEELRAVATSHTGRLTASTCSSSPRPRGPCRSTRSRRCSIPRRSSLARP